jgi:hypothetical protein
MKNEDLLNIKTPDTKTSLYLYNINTGVEINIKLIPNSLSESYSPNIISESPFGILHPINFYTGGSPKTISFEFDIHEDMVVAMGISDSLYKAMNMIKAMSEPLVENGVYKEPVVYLQLGEQFAGKGHISTKISYGKPYSKGRYKLAKVSLNFTYHELFKNDGIKRLFEEPSTITSEFALDELPSGYDSIEDFYKETLDYDYIITGTIFSEERQESFWNYVVSGLVDQKRREYRNVDIPVTTMSSLMDSVANITEDKSYITRITYNPWFKDVLRIYILLFDILSASKLMTYEAVYNDLDVLNQRIPSIREDYNNAYHPGSEYSEDNIVASQEGSEVNTSNTIWIPSEYPIYMLYDPELRIRSGGTDYYIPKEDITINELGQIIGIEDISPETLSAIDGGFVYLNYWRVVPQEFDRTSPGWYQLNTDWYGTPEEIENMIFDELEFLENLITKLQEAYSFLSNRASD